jgi:hypothetical protein
MKSQRQTLKSAQGKRQPTKSISNMLTLSLLFELEWKVYLFLVLISKARFVFDVSFRGVCAILRPPEDTVNAGEVVSNLSELPSKDLKNQNALPCPSLLFRVGEIEMSFSNQMDENQNDENEKRLHPILTLPLSSTPLPVGMVIAPIPIYGFARTEKAQILLSIPRLEVNNAISFAIFEVHEFRFGFQVKSDHEVNIFFFLIFNF